MTFRTSPAYNGSVTKVMVLENTQKTRLHAPTEKLRQLSEGGATPEGPATDS